MLIGRTFNEVPDIDLMGQYHITEIIEGSDADEFVDFGSKSTLEWGYGAYGLVFSGSAIDSDTQDYELECLFSIEDVELIGAYILDNDSIEEMGLDCDVEISGFRQMLDDAGYDAIEIKTASATLYPTGWATKL